MGKAKKHTPEQIVNILRQIEVANANGKTQPVACREAGITEQTFYRWRKEYGGQVERVFISSIRSCPLKFVLTVTAGRQPYTQRAGASCGKQIPHAITHNDAVENGGPQCICRSQEKVWIRLRTVHLIASYHRHSSVDSECGKRRASTVDS
jgi:hypothetical protein